MGLHGLLQDSFTFTFTFWHWYPLARIQRVAAVFLTPLAGSPAEEVIGNVILKWRFWTWHGPAMPTQVSLCFFNVAGYRKAPEADSLELASAAFCFGLFSDPENRGDALLKRWVYSKLQGRTLHFRLCYSLKYNMYSMLSRTTLRLLRFEYMCGKIR
jgi:hypothetical protein